MSNLAAPRFLQPHISGTAVAQDSEKQMPWHCSALPHSLHVHSVCTTSQFYVASAVLVPAAAWLIPWDSVELLVSPSTISMPQSTWMCRQQPGEGHDAHYHLSLATSLPFLCFLDHVTTPRLVFRVTQGSRRAGRVQTMFCLGLCITHGLSYGEKQRNFLVAECGWNGAAAWSLPQPEHDFSILPLTASKSNRDLVP